MTSPLRILLAQSSEVDRLGVLRVIKRAGLNVAATEVDDLASAKAAMQSQTFDCAIADYRLGDGKALSLLRKALKGDRGRPPLIVLTERGSTAGAVECMRAGAGDYLTRAEMTPERLGGTIRNVTRMAQAERELAAAHHRLETIVANAPIMLWATDLRGTLTLLRGRALEALGVKPDEPVGRPVFEEYGSWTGALANVRRALEGDSVAQTMEIRGSTYDARWAPLRDADGRVIGSIGVATDVSDRRRAEQAQSESEGRFRALADDTPVMIWMLGTDRSCTYLNRSWLDFTGRTTREGLGGGWIQSFHPDDLERCLEVCIRAFDRREPMRVEHRLAHRDGTHRWVVSSGIPRTAPDGAFLGYIGTTIDITEHRHAAEMLRQSRDELEVRVAKRTADLTAANRRLRREVRERKRAALRLRAYQERLRTLASVLSTTKDQERRRIAAGLHDHLGQKLALAKIKLGSLGQTPAGARSARVAQEVRRLIEESIDYTRALTFELGSPILDELGLTAALESLAEKFEEEHRITTEFKDHGRRKPLSQDLQVFLFQAARELLFNVAKHARASHVSVSIKRQDMDVSLTIQDNGTGFDPDAVESSAPSNRGFGLFSIRERLGHLGGRMEVATGAAQGTRITLVAPMRGSGTRKRHPKKPRKAS